MRVSFACELSVSCPLKTISLAHAKQPLRSRSSARECVPRCASLVISPLSLFLRVVSSVPVSRFLNLAFAKSVSIWVHLWFLRDCERRPSISQLFRSPELVFSPWSLQMELNIYSPLPHRKDFRIGILGSGFIVNECHLVAYRKAGFEAFAIASRKPEHAAQVARQHGLTRAYETYEQLLDDPSIEVLDIAGTPDAQLGLIKAACARKTVK